jgi:hypothetical protein
VALLTASLLRPPCTARIPSQLDIRFTLDAVQRILAQPQTELRFLRRPASSLQAKPTQLSQLHLSGKQTPSPESASELYRPSDRLLLAKLVPRGQLDGYLRQYSRFSRPEPLLFLPSSSSVVLTRLSGPRSRPTGSQKIW